MIESEEREKLRSMYTGMSDSGLIDLLCAFKKDYQSARERDDAVCMSFCEGRLELIEQVLCNRK